MKITINATNKDATHRIRDLLYYTLARFEPDISRVRVCVRSESDALGKDLSHCRVTTHLMNDECIAVQELQFSEALAISRAIERTGSALKRRRRSRRFPLSS